MGSSSTVLAVRSRSRPRSILYVLVGIRLLNAITLRTFFQPDEYFQALEPALKIAFGDSSNAWITWEWRKQLRSSLHPRLFAVAYLAADYAARAAGLSPHFRAELLIVVPKLLQSVLAAIGDWYTWRLAEKVFGREDSRADVTLLMTLFSPWQWYVSTRTFSNSLETVLTVAALFHWPWRMFSDARQEKTEALRSPGEITGLRVSLLLAAIAVVLRPTNVIIWASVATLLLTRLTLDGQSPVTPPVLIILIREAILCGGIALSVSLLSDRLFFGAWVFPPYKFLYFNLSQSLAAFYGQNVWHYYLSQGIPLLSFGALPFVVFGLWKALGAAPPPGPNVCTPNILRTLGFASVSLMACLSLITHKEVRFIYPLLPVFHVLAAPHVVSCFLRATENNQPGSRPRVTVARKPLLASLIAINVVVGGYLSYFHAAAPIAVVDFLRHEWEARQPESLTIGVDTQISLHRRASGDNFAVFLVPCHTSPWRSHLVYPSLTARALTCEPPLETLPGSDERRNYKDETDIFYANITSFLGLPQEAEWSLGWDKASAHEVADLRPNKGLPTFIVGFDRIEDELLRYFEIGDGRNWSVKLVRRWSMWNGLFSDDWKKEGTMIAWEVIDTVHY